MTRIEAYKNALVAELQINPLPAEEIVVLLAENGLTFKALGASHGLIATAKAIQNEVEESFTEPLTR